MENKTCSKCGEVKPIDCFYKSTRHKSGIRNECKMCANKIRCEAHKRNHPNKVAMFRTSLKERKKHAALAKYGKDLIDLHNYRDDSISYDDAMHEINGY